MRARIFRCIGVTPKCCHDASRWSAVGVSRRCDGGHGTPEVVGVLASNTARSVGLALMSGAVEAAPSTRPASCSRRSANNRLVGPGPVKNQSGRSCLLGRAFGARVRRSHEFRSKPVSFPRRQRGGGAARNCDALAIAKRLDLLTRGLIVSCREHRRRRGGGTIVFGVCAAVIARQPRSFEPIV